MKKIIIVLTVFLFIIVGCSNEKEEEFITPQVMDHKADDYYLFITSALDEKLGLEVMVLEYTDINGEVVNQFVGRINNEKIEYGEFLDFAFNKEIDEGLEKVSAKLKLYDKTNPDEDVKSGKAKPFAIVELAEDIKYGEWNQYVVKQQNNKDFIIEKLK